MRNPSLAIFPCISSSLQNTRWGQVVDLPPVLGVIEIHSCGNAQEQGVSEITRLSKAILTLTSSPRALELKESIDSSIVKSFLFCIIQESICELCVIGNGKIFLRRGKMLSPLLVTQGIIKGSLKKGDCLIFLSKTAADLFNSEEKELFSPVLTAKEIAETMSILIAQKGEKAEGATCLVVEIFDDMSANTRVISSQSSFQTSFKNRFVNFFSRIRKIGRKPSWFRHGVVLIIAGFFCFSVFLGIRKQQTDHISNQRRQAVEQAQNLLREGIALTDIQPLKSKEYLEKALGLLSPYVGESLPKGKEGRTIQQLEKQLQDNLRIISRIYTPDVQIFYDASFLQKDRVVSLFTVGEDELAFADTNAGMVAVVSLLSKEARVVAGGNEYTSTRFLSFVGQNLYIVTKDSLN
ncbi:MAG: hypothetical protein N3A54_06385, partial [Patescibacteria group bacterium]|nr:hypothetical protein [Patescibacteria group bacterium]